MAFWLFKSEPDVFSFDDLIAKGEKGEQWDGVRNYQARNNMRAMQVGERGLFYHSNIGKEVVGICEVVAPAHPDSTADDPKWECVDIKALARVNRPVTLDDAKVEPRLSKMVLVNNSRLSVQPVADDEWEVILELAGGTQEL
ncbi:EVE domain-containing protein [Paracoccus sp. MBLB3053]|uniref:EVE domain-containing protein n=1 Tax=Paracoccus aurantius TaxID=3073814 RepID=A0ABU2HPM4_9RHOB|nr:EVE domain-containing protein [Paracoccus sp. MBLB3053]MDS9466249.1 EVE domain-containing protein [Paracoccus sp. MBLB3053]